MRQHYLIEEKLPPKLPVSFSAEIRKKINDIYAYNQNNIDGLYQWDEYIEGLKSYISNRSIAFDYANRYTTFPNGARHLRDLGYDVSFIVSTNKNTNKNYVYVFMANLKPEEFGLKVPNRNATAHPSDTTNQICSKNNVVSTNISVDNDGNYVSANSGGADYVSESKIYNIIRESVKRFIITENQEYKSIRDAKNLVMQRNDCTKEEADEYVRIKIRRLFPILHYKKPAKFILGVTRMYLDGQLENKRIASKLYSTISYISTNGYYEQYDRNLNNMSAEEFINDFYPSIENDLNTNKENIKRLKITNQSNDYDIVKIDSFEQAEKYWDYCQWCICEDEYYYDEVGQNGLWQLYFLLKKGFENIKGGDDYIDKFYGVDEDSIPANLFDEYGMSMIAIYVDEDGRLVICKNRYNDDKLFDNSCILTTRQISQLIGKNFYEVFKPKESNGFATNESISKYDRINGLKRLEGINENKSTKPIIETYIQYLIRESVRTALMEHLSRERKRRNHRPNL